MSTLKYLVKKSEMQQYDRNTIETFGVPSLVLIERAALAAAEELERALPAADGERILVVCGTGNNGADGLVLARLLYLAGRNVQILLAGTRARATKENQTVLSIAEKYGVPVSTYEKTAFEQQLQEQTYTVIVDAIFGVGLSRRIEGAYDELIRRLNELDAAKVALDIPSGIDADDGQVLGVAFLADLTITFSYEKLGMRLFPGQRVCGQIICRNVGIDDRSFLAENGIGHAPVTAAYTDEEFRLIPKRRTYTNKGSYGKVLVIAGSINMAGAAVFSAKAAYLSGCGLVRVVTPEENRVIIQSTLPEAVLTTYNSKKPEQDVIISAMQWADVIVCGPGLGTTDAARRLVQLVLKNAAVPLVLDADALNLIAEETEVLRKPHTDLIITPHLGEMARLNDTPVSYLQAHLVESAQEFARTYNLICVLKDARTVTAIPYGMTYLNMTGNNGMATGGSGDVLTGVIASLIAQGMPADQAAPLGVYLHGAAGDAAAARVGCYSLTASALLDALTEVFHAHGQEG